MFRGRSLKQVKECDPDLHYRTKNSFETAKETAPLTNSRVSGCRYELKYHITESQTAGIIKYIKPFVHLDKYCRLHRSNYYPIVSLYLDSEDLDLCRESLVGLKNRFKLRIRSYTDDLDYPRFLEIKRRMNNIIIKNREAVMDLDIPTLLAGRSIPVRSDNAKVETLNQFQLYLDSIRARPVVLVRYMRQAYEDNYHNRLRITFDRELVYKITSLPEVKLGGRDGVRIPIQLEVLYWKSNLQAIILYG